MSERTPDDFIKRATTATDTAAKTLAGTIALTTVHWLIKCLAGGHWHYLVPDDALLEMWVMAILPSIHLVWRVGQAKIEKWAREQGVDSTI